MARRGRIDPVGGWHHVMNRGAGGRDVFHRAGDARHFLRLVGEGCSVSGVQVHAFCLMVNHYHLLVRCPDGGLSSFMHRLGSMYTRYSNHRRGSDGPIFRSRFHSLVIDSDDYLLCAARYIHRNPLDRGPTVALQAYRWSSLRYYAGIDAPPAWLHTATLTEMHGSSEALIHFVEGAETDTPLGLAIETALLEAPEALASTPHVRRAITVAMLDRSTGPVREALLRQLGLETGDAARRALARSRRRVAANPVLGQVAARVLTGRMVPGASADRRTATNRYGENQRNEKERSDPSAESPGTIRPLR